MAKRSMDIVPRALAGESPVALAVTVAEKSASPHLSVSLRADGRRWWMLAMMSALASVRLRVPETSKLALGSSHANVPEKVPCRYCPSRLMPL